MSNSQSRNLVAAALFLTFGVFVRAQPQPSAPVAAPSAGINPSLASLRQALAALRVEKWKASSQIRRQAEDNLDSIRRDLDQTLPPLLAAVDSDPASISRVLPIERNLGALYDVLIRVDAVADAAAPAPQAEALEKATGSLKDARSALADSLESTATLQEKQIIGLEATVARLSAAPPVAPAPVCPAVAPPAPKKKAKPKPKPPAQPNPS